MEPIWYTGAGRKSSLTLLSCYLILPASWLYGKWGAGERIWLLTESVFFLKSSLKMVTALFLSQAGDWLPPQIKEGFPSHGTYQPSNALPLPAVSQRDH